MNPLQDEIMILSIEGKPIAICNPCTFIQDEKTGRWSIKQDDTYAIVTDEIPRPDSPGKK